MGISFDRTLPDSVRFSEGGGLFLQSRPLLRRLPPQIKHPRAGCVQGKPGPSRFSSRGVSSPWSRFSPRPIVRQAYGFSFTFGMDQRGAPDGETAGARGFLHAGLAPFGPGARDGTAAHRARWETSAGVLWKGVLFERGGARRRVGSKTGAEGCRPVPAVRTSPARPRPPPPSVSDGPSESPEVESISRRRAERGEERSAQSSLSTGQGPSPGASKVPIDQATPKKATARRRGCAPPGPGQP